jgi:hypothetical protein
MIETRLTLDELIARYAHTRQHPEAPILVSATADLKETDFILGHDTTYRVKRPQPRAAQADVAPPRPEAAVFVLAKSGRNPFEDRITVGRADTNDVILPDKGVSKFHGYFLGEGDGMRLIDTRSTNGTFLDGHPVTEKGATASTRARVRFGPTAEFVFIARKDVGAWLDALASS